MGNHYENSGNKKVIFDDLKIIIGDKSVTILGVSCYNIQDLSGPSSYVIVSRRIISA